MRAAHLILLFGITASGIGHCCQISSQAEQSEHDVADLAKQRELVSALIGGSEVIVVALRKAIYPQVRAHLQLSVASKDTLQGRSFYLGSATSLSAASHRIPSKTSTSLPARATFSISTPGRFFALGRLALVMANFLTSKNFNSFVDALAPNYSVKWTAAVSSR
jgi:hypothetical protein